MWNNLLALVYVCVALLYGIAFFGVSDQRQDAFPLTIQMVDYVDLKTDEGKRTLPLRLFIPEKGESFPLIVLSHGTFSSKEKYDPVLSHWARHGFVVIAPDHVDSNYGRMPRGEEDMRNIIATRAQDVSTVIDSIPALSENISELKGKVDLGRIGVAGHSVGTLTVMLASGLRERHPLTGVIRDHDESRVDVVVLLSDPGKMALQPEDAWKGLVVPTFMVTGSADFGLMGDGRAETTYEMEILTGADAPKGTKTLLNIKDLDHYFGGLIHRDDPEVEPDPVALELFIEVSTAFLRANLEADEKARASLMSWKSEGFRSPRAVLTIE